MDDDIEILKGQRDALRRRLSAQSRWANRPAAAGLLLIGLALFAVWALARDGSAMSMLLLLAAVTMSSLAVLLYFLSPSAFLRAEVADAEAVSNALNVGRVLSGLLIEARGIYTPASLSGATKVFVPVAEGAADLPKASGSVFVAPREGARGIMLDPPGYGLLAHAREIGAAFTDEGLENELKDIVENGLELARRAGVTRKGDEVTVTMAGLANAGMCERIRKEDPGVCARIGCPVCSFAACAVAEGTGRRLRIRNVSAEGGTVRVTLELI